MKTLDLPGLFIDAGLNVELLDGWDEPHHYGYVWREDDPVLSMMHHTATSGYTPNRGKANMWAGLYSPTTGRLYQSGGGEPTIVIANAYPAPISSGYGQEAVIDLAKADIQNNVRATGPDDYNPKYAANRDAWNTEWVLDGVGSWIDDGVWDMMVVATRIMHQYMGWSPYRCIGHGQFTGRKIDLYDGKFADMVETMIAFRTAMMRSPEEDDMWVDDFTDLTWMTIFDAGLHNVDGNGRYYCSDDGTYNFDPPWGEGPTDANGVCEDGLADYAAKVNAINYLIRSGVNTIANVQTLLVE
jgi:hypothetical protein